MAPLELYLPAITILKIFGNDVTFVISYYENIPCISVWN
jgi:hypothetical protein